MQGTVLPLGGPHITRLRCYLLSACLELDQASGLCLGFRKGFGDDNIVFCTIGPRGATGPRWRTVTEQVSIQRMEEHGSIVGTRNDGHVGE